MAGTNLGKAYVQIVPSAEGIKGSITNILSGEAESAGDSAGSSIAGKLKSAIKAAGIGLALKEAFSEGADLQQSFFGGLDTLYGEAADAARNYARAASEAGISANDYAEQAVSFGAALKQSLGGDAVAAAEAANLAILDMADNAAKMGTDIGSIQNAYQGFAKQNYTMLDNLKLGYGGTRSEMERLLADAEELSGVHYDISNLADVYSAIHVIQEDLGLTGVAAQEASETFSGSFNAMKAAAQNFLGFIAVGEDIKPALTQLIQSTSTFLFDNLVPMLANVISALPEAVATFIQEAVPQVLDQAKALITEYLPNFLDSGIEMVNSLCDGLIETIPELVSGTVELVTGFIDTITEKLPDILAQGVEIVAKLVAGLIKAIPQIVEAIPKLTEAIIKGFKKIDWKDLGKQIIEGIINGVKDAAKRLYEAVKKIAQNALSEIKEKLGIHSPSTVFRDEVGKMIDEGIADGITQNASVVTSAMASLSDSISGTSSSIISGALGGLSGSVSGSISSLVSNALSRIPGMSALSQISSVISSIRSAISTASSVVSTVKEIKTGTESIINSMISTSNSIMQKMEENRVSIRFNDRDIAQSNYRGNNMLGQSLINQGV